MWPLSEFVNKLLNLEEVTQNSSDCSLSGSRSLYSLTDGIDHDVILPRLRFIEVPHVNQLSNWDCGLACVLMVLQTIGINNCSLHTLEKLCGTRSIWTVDLAYLLQKFSVIFSYFTVTIGANPNFSVESFYKVAMSASGYRVLIIGQAWKSLYDFWFRAERDHLPHDLVRVDMLFQRAFKAGISIECRSFSQEKVPLLILSGRYVAIALVDQCKLYRSWLEEYHVSELCGSTLDYTGHYVVICGYDADKDEFEIRDPASSRKYQKISSKHLDEARKSFGTDEDLLLISLDQRYNKEAFPPISGHVNEDP